MTAKVNGIRICKNSKGICHKGSWRSKDGQRKLYFRSESDLRNYYTNKLRQALKKKNSQSWWEARYTDEEWIDFRNEYFEKIDVISR